MTEKFERRKRLFESYKSKDKEIIGRLYDDYKKSLIDNDIFKQHIYLSNINSRMEVYKYHKYVYEYMRLNNDYDLKIRKDILDNYARKIDECISDEYPIVFHGIDKLNVVEEIFKSGGLISPDERNINFKSFASQIDVTYKKNIQTSLRFAEPGDNTFLPYGAIFVFLPSEDEYDNVINSGNDSEVFGGVKSINFRNNPDRLIGIITTKENYNLLNNWCIKYGIDVDKLYNHETFLNMCKDKYFDKQNSR